MNLTDEEIRIKVAESLGWVQIWKRQCGHNLGAPGAFDWVGREKPGGVEYILPNYPADLNACAEFEATLTDEELSLYGHELGRQTECMQWYNGYISAFGITVIARATARQRCLAYLKTKGIIP